jgi:DNA-binding FadR family transcriptional regulator
VAALENARSRMPPRGKAAWIASAIRDDVAGGVLQPGDALPPESVLMQEYNVSQPTMRAALRILESEGLVRIQRGPGGGPRILELDVDVLAQRAGLYLQVEGADLFDLFEALTILQPGAVGLAARRRTDEQLAELRRCVHRAYACMNMREFSAVAADFVVSLLDASGNETIRLFGVVIRRLVHEELHRFLDGTDGGAERIVWHARRFSEVVDLVEAGESEAAAALWRAHMLSTVPRRGDPPRANGRTA